ncbi:MAG: M14 family zinc carboxypeptidase [Planctomycetota bacterium]|nr:M14 family zinc carboxypeptidase [Planctomycetota bacterium]
MTIIPLAIFLLGLVADPPIALSITPRDAISQARMIVDNNRARASITTIGKSWSGQSIEVIKLSDSIADAEKKPAILLVSGLDGSRPSSVAIAVAAVKKLLETPEILQKNTFYVIPCANPDSYLETFMNADGRANRNTRPVDEDRDGRIDEDPAKDINGDGAITMMRRLQLPANDPPTHLADPSDPRLLRTPDATKDQRAIYTLYTEGLDSDRDGLVAEDDIGGVDIDRNFPHRWPEFSPNAGNFQLSEPESQALVKFVFEHPRIVGALVIGRWDNLVKTPDSKAKDITGKTPLALDSGDSATWEEMGSKWRELSGQARTTECDPSGSFALWLYAHRGIATFATQAWGRPDASPVAAAPVVTTPVVTAPVVTTPVVTAPVVTAPVVTAPVVTAPVADAPPAKPPKKPADEESAGWLAWNDRDQAGRGFIAWTPFNHPTLGPVEIGGFRSRFRTDPPPSEIPKLADAVAGFLSELAKRQAKISIRNLTSKMVAPGIYEIEMELVNDGWLPTTTAMGKTNRQPEPIILGLSTPKDRILSGQRVTIIDGLTGVGGRKSFRWLVQSPSDDPIILDATWKPNGTYRASITGEKVTLPTEVIP